MPMKKSLTMTQTPIIIFGQGQLKQLGRQARFLGAQRALVVSDPVMRELGIVDRALESLASAGIAHEVFLDVHTNPTDEDVARGAELYVRTGCTLVVGVGGGSPLDAAKALRVLVTCGGSIEHYDVMAGGSRKIPWGLPPMIAIPTTAGTGSEVTYVAVITIPARRTKISIIGVAMTPTIALVDPDLSALMPQRLTAETGMDALAHCVESYCVDAYCPPADQAALGGIALVAHSLPEAVRDGGNMDARADMAMAALLGGLSFPQKGVGAAHALAHPLSAVCGVPHGLANSILLPHVMEMNCPAARAKFERIASCMKPGTRSADDAPRMVRELAGQIGLPQRLSEIGVSPGAFDEMVNAATLDISLAGNPVTMTAEQLRALYEAAF